MKLVVNIFYFILVGAVFFSCKSKLELKGDILIKGGLIIDGTGALAYRSDVLITGDEIVWIGLSEENEILGDTIISATGQVLAPGFIDIHAHGDPRETPEFSNFLSMGVTSIALGMDGSSTESSEMQGWMIKMDSMDIGVNIIPFIGHGTVRMESGIGMSKHVKSDELGKMSKLVNDALGLGCWGLSMGLEYLPGYYADSIELLALARVVGRHNGLITSHIRNEDNDAVEKSLDEMIALYKHCNVNISHLKVVYGKGSKRANEISKKLVNTDYKNNITADIYPYTASYTGIGIVFPEWAKNPKTYAQIKIERGEELLEYLRQKITQRNGPAATLFGSGPYAGKTLQDLVEEYSRPYEVILRDIIGPYGASAAYFVMDSELQEALMIHPKVMIASDGSPTMRHPRGYGTFAKVINQYVMTDSILSIEEAIYKMTGLPAKTLGMKSRGIIQVGQHADLVIFNPLNVENNATFEYPHRRASGMNCVIVNGVIAQVRGNMVNRGGRLLRRKADRNYF